MYDQERGLYIAHSSTGALSIKGKMANRRSGRLGFPGLWLT